MRSSIAIAYFEEAIPKHIRHRLVYVPKEGLFPTMYMEAFPGIIASDFEGVAAAQGLYTVRSGKVIFVPKTSDLHTAAEMVVGKTKLLANIADRLRVPVQTKDDIDSLLRMLRQPTNTA
jgi:hypothetical protein